MSEPVVIAFSTEREIERGSKASRNVRRTRLNRLAIFGVAVALACVADAGRAAPLGHGAAERFKPTRH